MDSDNLIREFSASDEEGKPLLPVKTYEVEVKTGDVRGAGTDSNVYIEIYGENGNTITSQIHCVLQEILKEGTKEILFIFDNHSTNKNFIVEDERYRPCWTTIATSSPNFLYVVLR